MLGDKLNVMHQKFKISLNEARRDFIFIFYRFFTFHEKYRFSFRSRAGFPKFFCSRYTMQHNFIHATPAPNNILPKPKSLHVYSVKPKLQICYKKQ